MRKLKLDELGRMSVADFKAAGKLPIAVILDNIRSMHNVGSVFRSSDAFRIGKVWLTGYTPKPPHREIRKVAIGAEESVDWEYREDVNELIDELKANGHRIIAVEQTDASISLEAFEAGEAPLVLVFGNEVEGVQDAAIEKCDEAIEIPQFGTKHSLNISVAAGVVLYAVASQYEIPD